MGCPMNLGQSLLRMDNLEADWGLLSSNASYMSFAPRRLAALAE